MQQLIAAKVTFDEARLESALLKVGRYGSNLQGKHAHAQPLTQTRNMSRHQLGDATGRLRHLADYDWRFGAGMEQNLRCCGYMLNNCSKVRCYQASCLQLTSCLGPPS